MIGAIDYSIGVGILGIVCVVLDFVFVTLLNIVAEKQVRPLITSQFFSTI